MSDTCSFRLGSVCRRLILATHCPEGPLQLPDIRRDECFRRPDIPRRSYRRVPVEFGATRRGRRGQRKTRHCTACTARIAGQPARIAGPARARSARRCSIKLDVRAHAPCTHAHSPHGMLTTQAAGPPHALLPFGQPALWQLSAVAESAPSGASPNEVILGRHVPSPSASMHHDASMPSPISRCSPQSNTYRPLVVRDAQSVGSLMR